LKAGQQSLQKKSCSRLIYVSDFINPETGQLMRDRSGTIVQDARKIIYPGSNGDSWWDMQQLLAQMNDAVTIFKTAFLGKQGLFIYDNSSAHASLPANALKAFEMNKVMVGSNSISMTLSFPSQIHC
jgi:hypothetical protein